MPFISYLGLLFVENRFGAEYKLKSWLKLSISVPLVGNSSFNGELLNSTSISIDLTSNAENFDNGTVTVTDTNGTVLEEKSFARADFPFQIHDLPNITTLDNIQIRFQFSVGTVVDCGNGVIVSSVEEFFTLDPKDCKSKFHRSLTFSPSDLNFL